MSSKKNDIKLASPKVRKFARELGTNISNVKGSQRSGRITEEDVKQFVKSQVSVDRGKVVPKKYKDEMKKTYGEKKIHEFRRSWNTPPDPLNKNNPYHPINIETYKDVPLENIPDTESLKDTYERVLPYFKKEIQNKLENNKNVLVAAHGNSIRAICKFLFNLDEKKIPLLEIPYNFPARSSGH